MDIAEEINEFMELIESIDPDIFDFEDRVLMLAAYFEFKKKVEPIYLKYAAMNPNKM